MMRSILMLVLLCGLVGGVLSFLPSEHQEFFFKNNPEAYRTFCSDQQVGGRKEGENKIEDEIETELKLRKYTKGSIENAVQSGTRSSDGGKSSIQVNCSTPVDDLKCWGYEEDAKCRAWSNKYPVRPFCTEKFPHYEDLEKNRAIFYEEADFGYVQKKRDELKFYCKPAEPSEQPSQANGQSNGRSKENSNGQPIGPVSSLRCTDYLRFCEGRNIFIDFRKLATIQEPMRYRADVLGDGDVGGWNCRLNRKLLNAQAAHRSPLQSWYEELEHFTVIDHSARGNLSGSSSGSSAGPSPDSPANQPMHQQCDITLDQTTYVMKLDALTNLYHHFCDFVNLYVSLHLANDFSTDKQILIWDTRPYRSNFGFAWKAFTSNPLLDLHQFTNRTVCFRHVVFPLLPRMVYGLYYNMPLIRGCQRSGLFHAFNRHLLNGLGILKDYRELLEKRATDEKFTNDNETNQVPIRITFLSRTTAYRRVLNEHELIGQIKKRCDCCKVTRVDFNHQMPFEEQLSISARTDVFIGIHGAGLTHLLFLPDWAVVFELFNCDDECYQDLARLRGVQYLTWKDRSKLKYVKNEQHHKRPTSYLKFTDYQFDKDEFMNRLQVAISSVRRRKAAHLSRFDASDSTFANPSESDGLQESNDPKRSDDRGESGKSTHKSPANHLGDLPKTEL